MLEGFFDAGQRENCTLATNEVFISKIVDVNDELVPKEEWEEIFTFDNETRLLEVVDYAGISEDLFNDAKIYFAFKINNQSVSKHFHMLTVALNVIVELEEPEEEAESAAGGGGGGTAAVAEAPA